MTDKQVRQDCNGEIAELIESMRQGLVAAPDIYQPGSFWDGLIGANLDMLQAEGIENFKRTVSNNYYNWLVTSIRDPQVQNALLEWVRRPTMSPLRARLHEPITGLRTTDRDHRFDLSRRAARQYTWFVGMLWEIARRNDPDGLTSRLTEPELGNPVRISQNGRLISQDLANSIVEYSFVARAGLVDDGARVAELGAGYGRLAYVYAEARAVSYCIFDIPPALAVAQWYLTAVLGRDRIVPYERDVAFVDVESRLVPGTVGFFTPDQLDLFPDGWFGCTQTISTLPEMPAPQATHYLQLLAAKARSGVFLKQWRRWRKPGRRRRAKRESLHTA